MHIYFEFITETEIDYPFVSKANNKCAQSNNSISYRILSYSAIFEDLKLMYSTIVNYGPLVAYVSASSFEFQHYSSGIFNDVSCSSEPSKLDHGILIVGYGTDQETNQDYWLLKNR